MRRDSAFFLLRFKKKKEREREKLFLQGNPMYIFQEIRPLASQC